MKNIATNTERNNPMENNRSFQICLGLIGLSDRITRFYFAVIGLKKPLQTRAKSSEDCNKRD